jgi:hypothetical protein
MIFHDAYARNRDLTERSTMTKESPRLGSFPLRLPHTMRKQAHDIAHREGLSLNQFISLAVAEKITRLEQSAWMDRRTHSENGRAALPEE